MKKIILVISLICIFSSCSKRPPYRLEKIEYLGREYNWRFLCIPEIDHKYSIIISENGQKRQLNIYTYRKISDIQEGDSVYIAYKKLIKK